MVNHYEEFLKKCHKILDWNSKSIPLCAAENVISPFAKIPLDSFLQEKYIMGGILNFQKTENFIGSSNLYEFYDLINDQCATLFSSTYADPRTLSGVNAVTTLLMSLFNPGDLILISSEDCGGHGSMPKICSRLGIKTETLPYRYEIFDFNYDKINLLVERARPNGILICLSDIIKYPALQNIKLPEETTLIFDATQVLGLIAGGVLPSILKFFSDNQNVILMGATHKTLPGPTCGLIMTRNNKLAEKFDRKINPDYLRNNQFHHILSLSLTLLEMEYYGKDYSRRVVENANKLGTLFEKQGINVLKCGKCFTQTHQVFLSMPPAKIECIMNQCEHWGITLNARYKKLYKDSGIRIGTQEVSRYGWGEEEMTAISEIISSFDRGVSDEENLQKIISSLSEKKQIHYSFPNNFYSEIYQALHDN